MAITVGRLSITEQILHQYGTKLLHPQCYASFNSTEDIKVNQNTIKWALSQQKLVINPFTTKCCQYNTVLYS